MKNYKLESDLSYDLIGREIDLQTKYDPKIREIKFEKAPKAQVIYLASILQKGENIPPIGDCDFIDVAPRKELKDILNDILSEDSLPQVIRVIHPNLKKDSWGIFFKQ